MVSECKPEWNREAITVFSRLPSLMAALLQLSLLMPLSKNLPQKTIYAVALAMWELVCLVGWLLTL